VAKRHFILVLFLLSFPVAICAVPVPTLPCLRYPKGKEPAAHALPLCVETPSTTVDPLQRVVAIRKTLPIPADWHFFMLSEAEWKNSKGQGLGTHTAYSNLAYKTTFIRESYAISAQDSQFRHTIAHEMGHRICNCTNESTADRIADQLTRATQ
jgi:hypothetical protein